MSRTDILGYEKSDCFTALVPREATPLYLVYDETALDGLLYRIVKRCPPTLDDFRSYEALGERYDQRDFFRGTGISLQVTPGRARAIARRYQRGKGIATLDLRHSPIAWAKTGGRQHVTVWAPPELLLESVVQCVDDEL